MLNKRKEETPGLFQNKKALVIGASFLAAIDENYIEFLDILQKSAKVFEFPAEEIQKIVLDKDIDTLYVPVLLRLKKSCWCGLQIDLLKRTITLLDVISSQFSDEQKRKHLVAYAHIIPYVIKQIKPEISDTSKFTIHFQKSLPQVK